MKETEKVYEILNSKNIVYDVTEHEAVFTIEEMEDLDITSKGNVVKNLFVRNAKGNQHYLIVLDKDKKANLNSIQEQLGCTKLSFASDERLMKYLKLTKGAVSPFGILNDDNHHVILVFDDCLIGKKRLGIHPNDNTATVWIDFDDLKKLLSDFGTKIQYIKIP